MTDNAGDKSGKIFSDESCPQTIQQTSVDGQNSAGRKPAELPRVEIKSFQRRNNIHADNAGNKSGPMKKIFVGALTPGWRYDNMTMPLGNDPRGNS